MKKNNISFPFKYSVLSSVLIISVILLSFSGLFINLYNLLSFNLEKDQTVIAVIRTVFTFILFAISLSLIVFGKYTFNNQTLVLHFGFFRLKYNINDITQVSLFQKTNKLVAYFNNGKYTVIVIPFKFYDEFYSQLKKINKQVVFDTDYGSTTTKK